MDPVTENNDPVKILDTDPLTSGTANQNTPENKTAEPKTPDLVELQVNGEVRRVTQEELKNYAQKHLGSEDKFRSAAELRKEASPALAFQEAFDRLKDNSSGNNLEQDVYTVANYLGIDPQTLLLEVSSEGNPPMNNQNTSQSTNNPSNLQGPVRMDQLPSEVRDSVNTINTMNMANLRKNIETDLQNSLDTDLELAKVVNEIENSAVMNDTELAEFKKSLFDIALGDVQNQLFTTDQSYGPEMRMRVIQKLRSKANSLGISKLGKTMANPISSKLGILDANLAANIDNDQPPARVSAIDNTYADNFTKRFAYSVGKAARGVKNQ